jgi:SAM-dependent methyltransferase
VGSGAGSIARWLAERVAPTGEVVAADLDTVFLELLASPTLRVLRHDILSGPVERQGFDLVHARYLLEWLQLWEVGLDHLLASVRPGGVIVLSDIAWQGLPPAPAPLDALFAAFPVVMQQRGSWDPSCGRELADRLEAHGVHAVQAELHAARVRGGSIGIDWAWLSIEPLRRGLIELGGLDDATLQAAAAMLADPATSIWLPAMVSAWGTVP